MELERKSFDQSKVQAPGCLGYIRDEVLPSSLWGLFNKLLHIRIHIKQPGFNGK